MHPLVQVLYFGQNTQKRASSQTGNPKYTLSAWPMNHCPWAVLCPASLGHSGGSVHLRYLSGHFCGHAQPLGLHIRAHARCPLSLFLTVGFDTQLLQPGRKKSRRSELTECKPFQDGTHPPVLS